METNGGKNSGSSKLPPWLVGIVDIRLDAALEYLCRAFGSSPASQFHRCGGGGGAQVVTTTPSSKYVNDEVDVREPTEQQSPWAKDIFLGMLLLRYSIWINVCHSQSSMNSTIDTTPSGFFRFYGEIPKKWRRKHHLHQNCELARQKTYGPRRFVHVEAIINHDPNLGGRETHGVSRWSERTPLFQARTF